MHGNPQDTCCSKRTLHHLRKAIAHAHNSHTWGHCSASCCPFPEGICFLQSQPGYQEIDFSPHPSMLLNCPPFLQGWSWEPGWLSLKSFSIWCHLLFQGSWEYLHFFYNLKSAWRFRGKLTLYFPFFFFSWPHRGMWALSSWPGTQPTIPALEALSLNLFIVKEVPTAFLSFRASLEWYSSAC